MAGPGVYRKRKEKRERLKLAQKLADMPWEKDPYTGRVTGRLPGEEGTTRSPEDVEKWLRAADRAGRNGRPATPGTATSSTSTADVSKPRTWRTLWPNPPDTYGRWGRQGAKGKYQNWKDWYAPSGSVEDQPHLGIINQLLPYMNEDDVATMSRQLYVAGGGRTGPFADYLRASQIRNPVYGGRNREPSKAGWKRWTNWVESQGLVPADAAEWWSNRPLEGRVTDWEDWWENRPASVGQDVGAPVTAAPTTTGAPGGQLQTYTPGATTTPAATPGEWPTVPGRPAVPGTYRATLNSIERILSGIPDQTAKDWARAVFNVYRDWTRRTGVRTTEEEQVFQSQLEELMNNIPESAQPYAAALQRLVQPTVRNPSREWYELPAAERTAPTNWSVLGYTQNPQWM